jgi:hypothetical protein
VKPVEPVLEAGAQIQQLVNAECVEDFTGECAPLHYIIRADSENSEMMFCLKNQVITVNQIPK